MEHYFIKIKLFFIRIILKFYFDVIIDKKRIRAFNIFIKRILKEGKF